MSSFLGFSAGGLEIPSAVYLLDVMHTVTCMLSFTPYGLMALFLLTPAGGLEIPSAVYLLDVMRPGPRIAEVLDLVRPVLASAQNTKVSRCLLHCALLGEGCGLRWFLPTKHKEAGAFD
jgi:hypothetical protein